MRSRSDIQSSACSVLGIPSHRFSMLARVGFEMAWVEAAALGTMVAGALAEAARTLDRRSDEVDVRIIVNEMCVFVYVVED